jgi:hypothetical protein
VGHSYSEYGARGVATLAVVGIRESKLDMARFLNPPGTNGGEK